MKSCLTWSCWRQLNSSLKWYHQKMSHKIWLLILQVKYIWKIHRSHSLLASRYLVCRFIRKYFHCDRSVVFSGYSGFPPPIKLTVTIYCWNTITLNSKIAFYYLSIIISWMDYPSCWKLFSSIHFSRSLSLFQKIYCLPFPCKFVSGQALFKY